MTTRAVESYCNRLRVLARSQRTIELFRRYLQQHCAWLEGRRLYEPAAVRLSHLEDYAAFLLSRYANNSVLSRLLLVSRFYAWCLQQKLVRENPARGLHPPKKVEPLLPSPPDAETVFRVVGGIDGGKPVGQRNRAIIETLFSTGLRLSEFLNLEVGDVRLMDRSVLVRAGKGQKDRVVLLSKRAQDSLRFYVEQARPLLATGLPGHEGWHEYCQRNGRSPDKALWLAAHGGVLSRNTLACLFRQWARELGRPFHPHALRHAFAVHLLRKGADIWHVQALLGHDSLDTTKVYLRLVKDDYKQAYDRAFPKIKLRLW
jgi:site-specific recombinase XerD